MRKTYIIGLLLVLLVLAACVPISTPTPARKASPAATTMEVTAEQLYSDYKANEIAADAKYNGKLVTVTGVVLHLSL